MRDEGSSEGFIRSDVAVLLFIGLLTACVHILSNGQYGWHRDELGVLDNARELWWGYVEYPPVTPALARLALEVFGESLRGVRLVAVLAQSAAVVVTGLIARELGGSRPVQVVAALAVATASASVFMSGMMMYVSVEYLWWVLAAYFIVRRLRTGDERRWLAVGAVIGLGVMTKYTAALLAGGVGLGVLLTPLRRDLRSKWLWAGAALSLLVFAPNLYWQVSHDFISIDFLKDIHARDVRIGRTNSFLVGQLYITTNPFTLPVWLAGLAYFFLGDQGKRYRILGWMYVVPFVAYVLLQGRDYYLAPAYPALLAGGAVAWERWLAGRSRALRRTAAVYVTAALIAWGIAAAALLMPLAPVNSPVWMASAGMHDLFREQIGWAELVETVAGVYDSLPPEERSTAGILAGNYGEAGAIGLYGPDRGLPRPISGINSYWLRGPGDVPANTAVVVGFQRDSLEHLFERCELMAPVSNPYDVPNEESEAYEGVFLCRGLLTPWPELWPTFRWFG